MRFSAAVIQVLLLVSTYGDDAGLVVGSSLSSSLIGDEKEATMSGPPPLQDSVAHQDDIEEKQEWELLRDEGSAGIKEEKEEEKEERGLRIVGGQPAVAGQYPWFVQWDGVQVGLCGAALVADNVVLTAAHCGISNNNMIVGAMEYGSTAQGGQRRTITQRRQHPSWTPATYQFDYEVMQLDRPVTGVTPLALPASASAGIPANNEQLEVMGFGTTSSGGSSPQNLLYVQVPVVDIPTCQINYSQQGLFVDGSVMFCAGDFNLGGIDSCQGDSGGPIIARDGNGDPYHVGVVSWGIGCAFAGFPGVYAKTTSVLPWIQEQVCALANTKPSFCPGSTPTTPPPTPAPTSPPTPVSSCPSPNESLVEVLILTDNYGEETSFLLSDNDGNEIMSVGIDTLVSDRTVYEFRECVKSDTCMIFEINDSYGDGLCCQYGPGEYEVFWDGDLVASGAVFGDSEVTEFNCEPQPTPTRAPTKSPTLAPTKAPTTKAPTLAPTSPPTRPPTRPPTQPPTPAAPGPTESPTKAPTLVPTKAPTSSPPPPAGCDSGLADLKVKIKTDNYGAETSFVVTEDESGTTILSGSGFADNELTIFDACVDPSKCYTVQVNDSFGDGMCCAYGEGSFDVVWNGQVEASGGNFASSEIVKVGACSTNPPPSDDTATLEITFQTDSWAEESTLLVRDLITNSRIFFKNDFEDNTSYSFELDLDRDGCYLIRLRDSYGDGICCSDGQGYMEGYIDGTQIIDWAEFTTREQVRWPTDCTA